MYPPRHAAEGVVEPSVRVGGMSAQHFLQCLVVDPHLYASGFSPPSGVVQAFFVVGWGRGLLISGAVSVSVRVAVWVLSFFFLFLLQ